MDDVPAAAQISQADIIERQAESIARLKRQVQKGSEYKQLTKSKLKEAAARLKEYRLRVETLLQAEETLKKQLKDEQKSHEKTKKQHKSTLNQVKPRKHVRNAATQTEEKSKVTRTCQTQLSGNVERVNKRTMVDTGVQTIDVVVDTITSRKRSREQVAATQTEMDQLVPKLSRQSQGSGQKETSKDTKESTSNVWPLQEPLQILGDSNFQETSAALDAELAFSDSDESGGTGDTLEFGSGVEDGTGRGGAGSGLVAFDLTVSSEIDKELEVSSDEEERPGTEMRTSDAGSTTGRSVTQPTVRNDGSSTSLLGIDQAVQNEIDKELETSSEEDEDHEVGQRRTGGADSAGKIIGIESRTRIGSGNAAIGKSGEPLQSGGFDQAISNEIDKDLESSSDEEDISQGEKTNVNTTKAVQTGLVNGTRENIADTSQNKQTLMSIDDELDDEFAALDADSDPEHDEKKPVNGNKAGGDSSSSSSSSDSDSSDSDSDSDEDGDETMAGGTDNPPTLATEKLSHELAAENQTKGDDERRASSSPAPDKDDVVLTTPVEKKRVTAAEDVYSPIVEAELSSLPPEPLELASATSHSKEEEESGGAVAKKSKPDQEIPESPQPTKTVEGDTADAVLTTSDDVSSSRLSSPKHPAPFTSSHDAIKATGQDVDATTADTRQPVDSTRINLTSETSEVPTNAPDVGIPSPAGEGAPGKTRKAEEANLDDSHATPPKKAKIDKISKPTEDEAMPVATDSSKAKNKPAAPVETKEERRMKKSLATFKKAIVLGKGEEADNTYARRTLTVLVSQSSSFIDTHPAHVTTLCQILVDAYHKLEISPISVVRGALSIFGTPRSRRLMQETKWGLSWLCNQVLIRLMCSGDEARKQDVLIAPKSLTMSLVDECLWYLQDLLIEERTNIGDYLPASKVQVQVATQHINMCHDKAFLAQICALHTHLCKSTGQLSRSRVLLFDIVRANPDMRGLYFAMTMVEIYPGILEREFDQQCMERQMILKETVQQAFIVISGVASARDEHLLHLSSMMMLHRIADAIQMPELEQVDGTDPYLPRTYVEKLFDKFTAACQLSTSQEQDEKPKDISSTDYFEFAKSSEICTAVYGLDLVTQIFSIERCQELFANANVEAKSGIISIVGHIAMTIANDTTNRSEQYVESVIDWLYELLSTKATTDTSTKDHFKLLVMCSTVCVELILEYSASTGLDSRRRVLCAIVKWFDTVPSNQLIDLPASYLRRLRLAVVAARPQVMPATA